MYGDVEIVITIFGVVGIGRRRDVEAPVVVGQEVVVNFCLREGIDEDAAAGLCCATAETAFQTGVVVHDHIGLRVLYGGAGIDLDGAAGAAPEDVIGDDARYA